MNSSQRSAPSAELPLLPSIPRASITTRPGSVWEAPGDVRAMQGDGSSSSTSRSQGVPAQHPHGTTPLPMLLPTVLPPNPPGDPIRSNSRTAPLRSVPALGSRPSPAASRAPPPLRPSPPTQPGPRPGSSRLGAGRAPRNPSTDTASRRDPTRPKSDAEDAAPSRLRPGATPPAPHSPPPWPGASGGGGWWGEGGRGESGTRMWRRPLIGCGATRAGGAAEARRGQRSEVRGRG